MIYVLFCRCIQESQIYSSKENSLMNLQLYHKVLQTIAEVFDEVTSTVVKGQYISASNVEFPSGHDKLVVNNINSAFPETQKPADGWSTRLKILFLGKNIYFCPILSLFRPILSLFRYIFVLFSIFHSKNM